MAYVNILSFEREPKGVVLARVELGPTGIVTVDGPGWVKEMLVQEGAGVPGGERLFPDDGMRFLQVLKYEFDNAYLRATDVQV